MAVGDVDVFILDEINFKRFAKQGAFKKLDELASELNLEEDKVYVEKIEEEDKEGRISIVDEGVYGIDVSDSKILEDSKTVGSEMIAVISIRSKNYDNSVEFIKQLINSSIESS